MTPLTLVAIARHRQLPFQVGVGWIMMYIYAPTVRYSHRVAPPLLFLLLLLLSLQSWLLVFQIWPIVPESGQHCPALTAAGPIIPIDLLSLLPASHWEGLYTLILHFLSRWDLLKMHTTVCFPRFSSEARQTHPLSRHEASIEKKFHRILKMIIILTYHIIYMLIIYRLIYDYIILTWFFQTAIINACYNVLHKELKH